MKTFSLLLAILLTSTAHANTFSHCNGINPLNGKTEFTLDIAYGRKMPNKAPGYSQPALVNVQARHFNQTYKTVFIAREQVTRCTTHFSVGALLGDHFAEVEFDRSLVIDCGQDHEDATFTLHPDSPHAKVYNLECHDVAGKQ